MPDYKSWGESVQAYVIDKRRDVPTPAPPKPIRPTAEFNPVLMSYKDGKKDRATRGEEARLRVKAANRGRDRDSYFSGATYNVLNFQDRQSGVPDRSLDPPKFKRLVKEREFDIVHNKHPKSLEENFPNKDDPHSNKTKTETRDFCILSNKYVYDNDRKQTIDRKFARNLNKRKYWEGSNPSNKHDYDPLRGQFYDDRKEKTWQEKHWNRLRGHKRKSLESVPRFMRELPGYSEDLITQQKKPHSQFKAKAWWDDHRIKPLRYDFSKRCARQSYDDQEADESKAITSAHFGRYKNTLERGYDILTNTTFHGRGSKAPVQPRMAKRKGLWKRTSGPLRRQSMENRRSADASRAASQQATRKASAQAEEPPQVLSQSQPTGNAPKGVSPHLRTSFSMPPQPAPIVGVDDIDRIPTQVENLMKAEAGLAPAGSENVLGKGDKTYTVQDQLMASADNDQDLVQSPRWRKKERPFDTYDTGKDWNANLAGGHVTRGSKNNPTRNEDGRVKWKTRW